MALLITGYLVIRFGGLHTHHPAHLRLLTGFMTAITLLSLLFLLESALPPDVRLYALYLENMVLGVGLILLLQFAYRFPAALARPWEARLVLGLSSLYTLYEAGYAIYRYGLTLGQGHVLFRPEWADFPLALGLIWVPIVLARQSVRASANSNSSDSDPLGFAKHPRGLLYLWRPQGREASAARALMLIYLLPLVLIVITIFKTFYFIPPTVYQLSLSVGIMVTLAAFSVIYLNYLPDTTSFIIKLVGATLVTLLAVLGTVGWVLAPNYASLYHPAWPDHQTFRFTPNAQGGYDITAIPFHFETNFGDKLNLVDTIRKVEDQTIAKLAFDFPFYGKPYSEVYATNDGVIAMGQPIAYFDYQYHAGGQTPLIFPILTDLNPGEGSGGVLARRETDRLILTFDHVPSFYQPAALFTFQIALYHTGTFEITYHGLPEQMPYHANDEPMDNVWLIGCTPGDLNATPQLLDMSQLIPGQVISSGPQGILKDYYLGLRLHLNDLLLPLFWLMMIVSVLAITGFPWLFYTNLVKPVNALLRGVRRMEAGDYTAPVPVQFIDEFGFLTSAFNRLAARLDDLIRNLSAKVTSRTAELAEAKACAEEHRLIAESAQAQAEIANARLSVNVRELAARNEELDAFSHTVAHDIRNPVAQIVGYAQILGETDNPLSPEERTRSLRVILRASGKLTSIVDELLLLAGLRNADMEPESLNMAAIVAEVQSRLIDVIEQAGAEITLPIESAWPIALGHPAWVEEVWINYLSNACKYGGFNGQPPRITLGADPLPPLSATGEGRGGGFIRFWVHDYGKGIAPQDQARLFMPFTCLDQVHAKGYGLGLSIVRRIMEKLGGEAGVESDGVPGHGSVFSFILPAAPEGIIPPAPPPAPQEFQALDQPTLQGLSVLIVDDEVLFADSVRSLLTMHGLKVLGMAHDGQNAQELARVLNPQLILMDLDMPRVNGLVATRAIKDAQPDIRIVMLTASERDEHLFEAIRSGASGYLLKGMSANAFCAQLAGLVCGEVPLSPGLADRLLAEFARATAPATAGEGHAEDTLTDHQLAILERVARGQTYKEIGADLHLAEKTIKYHMGQIIDRLHVANRVQAVAYLRRTQRPK